MQVDVDLLNIAINGVYRDVGLTYKVRLITNTGLYEKTVTFAVANAGQTQLTASTYFAVPSGVTVSGVRVIADISLEEKYLDTPKTYTSNGTFTVSNIVIGFV